MVKGEERKRILGNSASFSPMRMEIFEKTFDTRLSTSAREKPKAIVFGIKKKTFVLEKLERKKGGEKKRFLFYLKAVSENC